VRRLLLACALVAGCASPPPETAPPHLGEALKGIMVGKSTKADIRAALGDATIVDFHSGYEVWVYRKPMREKAATELVLLFAPSGMLAKSRIRSGSGLSLPGVSG
jgi:hypothetical protein